ncbi:MAG TPA: nitrite reductase large subunit NirB [Acidimicrobiia bacterium]|nr:nitrite reductase large subunit NirB [Acidimicrobiia bacterium]
MGAQNTLVVVGQGMVGYKLLECLVENGGTERWRIVAFGEEPRAAYDRVSLSTYFTGRSAEDLCLADPEVLGHPSIEFVPGDPVTVVDRAAGRVTSASGRVVAYDRLVLATGSYPFVPPIAGGEGPGCFVYRTLEDLDAIRAYAADCGTGAVIGGGLLGLEAGGALQGLGLRTHIVEFSPRLMSIQVDEGGGETLRRTIEAMDISVHTSKSTTEVVRGAGNGRVEGLTFADGTALATDMVVFSAGIRPRDELARAADLALGERGGVLTDNACRTSDPSVYAIGECAAVEGRIYGLVSPGYAQARVVADRLMGGGATFDGADLSTKLKLLGVDVASFGDAHGTTEGCHELTFDDPIAGVYKKIVIAPDKDKLLGGILVGDATDYGTLHQWMASRTDLPMYPSDLILPDRAAGKPLLGVAAIGAESTVCNCNNVTKGTICAAIADGGLSTVGEVKAATRAGTGCGSCVPLCTAILHHELEKAGVAVDRSLCEHFPFTRQQLFDIVRVREVRTFGELISGWGRGRGCEICRPAVGSMLASLWNEYVLEPAHAGLQDTNDRFLANMQKDGSYSIVPRVPGGEITPEKLIVLGEVAREFNLYSKITGAQRIDLFGARLDQLPAIWGRLIDAGFESGHAYGKALRTVKSCVGSTWCRFGVQDSVSLAIEIELRYRGFRAPHKLKSAVSGCARECAEAQGKDFGVIATENGWNVYVCGNGGMRPQHAVLLAEDVDTETVIRYLDRFLMYYTRTADRLERTAPWFNRLEGGIDYLKSVIVDDVLGICAELEAEMQRQVETYRCEWKATIEDPEKVARFTTFVNAAGAADPDLLYVEERGQKRPARAEERPFATPTGVPVSISKRPGEGAR